jgi:hypothetical protein
LIRRCGYYNELEILMPKFSIDFEGWFLVEADDEEAAYVIANGLLGDTIPYDFQGGDWEVVNVNEEEDD